jgi:peptidoglycan/LPS O-acetylase OafA/YrhL
MFVVWGFFALFLKAGGSMRLAPAFFLITIFVAGVLGFLISRFYSEPLNRKLRNRFGDASSTLGSALEPASTSTLPTADPS